MIFDRLNKILEITQLKSFVNNLKDGIKTGVGNLGNQISGGEKQRIGIARALYLDRPIIVMDEATNSIDENTEMKIIEELIKLKQKTLIIISHNIKITKKCSKIIEIN